ncbi:unnamed protein product [Toxocara canis]|uniref:Secreted protein n=1 Tax=Toxocara canis TaxID=6265 RepID=A0A183VHF1_TOXCA|nr:unnamed protein product [Toxocara canis]
MAVTEIFANLVLALFGLIGCTQGGRGQDPLVVLAEMLVARAAAHQFHILLLEAACRAKGVQLMFWSAGQVGCTLFGLQGPLYSVVNNGRERIGLRGEPIIPVSESFFYHVGIC